jgi:predicted DsbA family dithiol-disulfide isomerase
MARDVFLAALDDPAYDRMVSADVEMARGYGLNGVPALIFDHKYLVSGAQPVDVLRQVVARITQENAAA